MKIEYMQVYAFLDGDANGYRLTNHKQAPLAQLGAEGWDLSSSFPITLKGESKGAVLILKRSLK